MKSELAESLGDLSPELEERRKLTAEAGEAVDIDSLIDQELTFGTYIEVRVESGLSAGGRGRRRGIDLSGVGVWMVWLIEALVIVAAGGYGPWKGGKKPYCESQDRWPDEKKEVITLDTPSRADLAFVRNAATLAEVFKLPYDAVGDVCGRLELQSMPCENPGVSGFLDVRHAWPAIKKNGKVVGESELLHESLSVTLAEVEALRALERLSWSATRQCETKSLEPMSLDDF
ncbi:MAG: hypothetical protein ACI9MR_001827 [Myxococcota bacterium]|jgi:hypothetical protein